jgi:hypothetical protein
MRLPWDYRGDYRELDLTDAAFWFTFQVAICGKAVNTVGDYRELDQADAAFWLHFSICGTDRLLLSMRLP